MRKVCVVVTARPSYSRIKTALRAIQKHPCLELQLVVAASALLDRYGSVVNNIENDGFKIDRKVFMVLEGEDLSAMAKTTGLGVVELSTAFNDLKPDVVVTIADRYETIATAIAASYMNIPLAHIQGGEVTGSIDEKVRHAITKLADLHFVSSEKSAERVIKMGENPEKVFVTGCPSVDIAKSVFNDGCLDFDVYEKYGGVGASPDLSGGYFVVMQHPVTTEHHIARKQIQETLFAIAEIDMPTLWFWPNVDAGSDGTSKGIRAFREAHDFSHVHFFKNMDSEDFLKVLYNSHGIVGNSSVAIRECAYLGVPAVNIGSRQSGRERGRNVIDVTHDRDLISNAVRQHMKNGRLPSDAIYGDGNAGSTIAELLSSLEFTVEKRLGY